MSSQNHLNHGVAVRQERKLALATHVCFNFIQKLHLCLPGDFNLMRGLKYFVKKIKEKKKIKFKINLLPNKFPKSLRK